MWCQKCISVHVVTWCNTKTSNSKFLMRKLLILKLKITKHCFLVTKTPRRKLK